MQFEEKPRNEPRRTNRYVEGVPEVLTKKCAKRVSPIIVISNKSPLGLSPGGR